MYKKSNNKLTLILGVSIILNILFIGMFLGAKLSGPRGFMRTINKGDVISKREFISHRRSIRGLRDELERVIQEEPYNKKKVLEVSDKVNIQMSKFMRELSHKIADKCENLPPEERVKLIRFGPRRR